MEVVGAHSPPPASWSPMGNQGYPTMVWPDWNVPKWDAWENGKMGEKWAYMFVIVCMLLLMILCWCSRFHCCLCCFLWGSGDYFLLIHCWCLYFEVVGFAQGEHFLQKGTPWEYGFSLHSATTDTAHLRWFSHCFATIDNFCLVFLQSLNKTKIPKKNKKPKNKKTC